MIDIEKKNLPAESPIISEEPEKSLEEAVSSDEAENVSETVTTKLPLFGANYPKTALLLAVFAALLCLTGAFMCLLSLSELLYAIAFFALTALILFYGFYTQFSAAIALSRLLKGKKVLAKWELSHEEVEKAAGKAGKRHILPYVPCIALSFILSLFLAVKNGSVINVLLITAFIISCCFLIISILLFLLKPYIDKKRVLMYGSSVIIGETCVYEGGSFHYHKGVVPELTRGHYIDTQSKLLLTYTYMLKDARREDFSVYVDVPETEENTVLRLIKKLDAQADKYENRTNAPLNTLRYSKNK